MALPEKGWGREALFEKLEAVRSGDLRWREGRTFAYVYDAGREVEEVGSAAFAMYLAENGLDPTVYPSLLQIENEIIGITASHLHAPEQAAGTFTSGGTESILLAVKAARDHARAHRPEVKRPQMVLPTTAHAAFHKAADYFDVEPVLVDVDPETFKAIPQAMAEAIGPDTILMVGSSPSYPHGVIDPIGALAKVAQDKGVLFHVDACVGGWLLPFFARLGAEVPAFDFRVPGVTSISMDLHKYAFTPKGASVVLYRDASLRAHQIFACADWAGYTVINPGVQSTKSGGPLAAAWAVMHRLGDDGYVEIARQVKEASERLAAGVAAIEGLYLMAPLEFCMFAFRSDEVNIFHIIDEMKVRGWYIQPQLHHRALPATIHISVNPGNVRWVEPFLADLAEATEAARKLPDPPLAAALGDQLAALGEGPMTEETFLGLLAMAGIDGVSLPERMANINALLNALPPSVNEALLTAFLNKLYWPSR